MLETKQLKCIIMHSILLHTWVSEKKKVIYKLLVPHRIKNQSLSLQFLELLQLISKYVNTSYINTSSSEKNKIIKFNL